MFAQLGNTRFEGLKTFSDYSKKGAAVFAEHALIDSKPLLQRTGLALDELTLTILLHVSFCNPKQELQALKTARDAGEVLPLLWGNGDVEGNFVITELEETIKDADKDGSVFCYEVSLSLKEFFVKNKLTQLQHESRNNAKAAGPKKPVTKPKKNPGTCPQTISGIVNKIDNHSQAVNKLIIEKSGAFTAAVLGTPENRATLTRNLTAMQKLNADLLKRAGEAGSCAAAYPDIKYRAEQVEKACSSFLREVAAANVTRYEGENKIQLACVRNLKAAARPLTNQTITRK